MDKITQWVLVCFTTALVVALVGTWLASFHGLTAYGFWSCMVAGVICLFGLLLAARNLFPE